MTLGAAALFAVLALRGTGLGFVMITVALGQIVWGVAYRWISLTNGDNGVSITSRPAPFGLSLVDADPFYWATLVVFLVAVAAIAVFVASPFGASLRGTRDQPRRMNALGYNVWLIRFLAFLFSGFWSGVAGLLFLYYNQFVSPQTVALTASAEVLLMVISGGTATLLGPIAGAAARRHHEERGERLYRALELRARRDLRRHRHLHARRAGAGLGPAVALGARRWRQRLAAPVATAAVPPGSGNGDGHERARAQRPAEVVRRAARHPRGQPRASSRASGG